jgi:tetratricopeptide (TPR) repeat protein
VFGAGITPESAEAVCVGSGIAPGEVLDLLAALVDRSLLQVADAAAPRYRMLETLREYGLERLAADGELEAARTAHAHYFAALADAADPHLRRPEQLEWFHRLAAERENLLAALRHFCETGDARRALRMAVSLAWFWLLSGSRAEANEAMALVAALPGDAEPVDRLLAVAMSHASRMTTEDRSGAIRLLDALEGVDYTSRPLVTAVLPLLALVGGQPERAERLFEAAGRDADPWIRAATRMIRAQVAENEGDVDAMRVHLAAALEGHRAVGDRCALALTLASWGAVRTLDGALDEAAAALEEALALLAELDAGFDQLVIQLRLADVRMRQGDLDGARALLASRPPQAAGGEQEAIARASQARMAQLAGDLDEARDFAAQAQRALDALTADAAGRGHGDALVNGVLAMIDLATGDHDAATDHLQAAYRAAVEVADMPILAAVGVAVAEALIAAGAAADAAEVLGAAVCLRGAEDLTSVDIGRLIAALRDTLGDDGFAAAYARGRALDREGASARLDPAVLRAPPVGT